MKVKLKKPKKAKHVTNLYVPGKEVILENVVRFCSQQKQNWQLGEFLIFEDHEIKREQYKFVQISVEGL